VSDATESWKTPPPADPRPCVATGFWLMIGLLALVAVGKVIQADTLDPDAFWHLRVADQLLHDGIGPLVDHISFASLKTPWTPYSWLAELLMKFVWDLAGYRGAMLVTAGCSGAIVALLALACRERVRDADAFNPVAIALCTAIGEFFTLPFISFRPVTMALVILGGVVWLLLRDRRRPTRAVWWCVPLTVLMTNLHLYSIVCVLLAGASAVGMAFDDRTRVRRQLLLAIGVMLAACCTPMLRGAVATAIRYNDADPMVAANFITEMRPFYTGATGRVCLALVIGMAALCVWNRRRLSVTDWLWLALSLVLLFRLGRFSPVFALIAMPIITRATPPLGGTALGKPIVKLALAVVLAAGIVSIGSAFPWDTSLDAWLNRQRPTYPTEAAAYIDQHITPHEHKLINEFNWGGYLAWRLGDRYQVLMDGRTQLYTPEFWRQTHLGNTAARTEFLKTVRADAAVLPTHDSALAASLIQLNWSIAYHDDLATIFAPPPLPTTTPHTGR